MVVGLLTGAQLVPATAWADPEPAPPPTPQLHNVVYQARIDGVSRNAVISYKIDDDNINSATPTMLPGRTFESTGVVSDPQQAGMKVSIDWPYSANLHCEILIDDQIVAQADTWVAPRLTRQHDDPDYGTLPCGANLSVTAGVVPAEEPPAPAPPA